MPEYLSPGVYVEEIEIGGKPIEGVSTSTAGFLGLTERGPESPTLITGFEQFRRLYGRYLANSFFAYGVEGFFTNGGQRCFVGRIVAAPDARSGRTTSANDGATINIEAVGPGLWGNRIAVKIERGSLNSVATPLFKLTVMYWAQMPPTSPRRSHQPCECNQPEPAGPRSHRGLRQSHRRPDVDQLLRKPDQPPVESYPAYTSGGTVSRRIRH